MAFGGGANGRGATCPVGPSQAIWHIVLHVSGAVRRSFPGAAHLSRRTGPGQYGAVLVLQRLPQPLRSARRRRLVLGGDLSTTADFQGQVTMFENGSREGCENVTEGHWFQRGNRTEEEKWIRSGVIMPVKTLLYSDFSLMSLSSAAFAAILIKNDPVMQITIISQQKPPGKAVPVGYNYWQEYAVRFASDREILHKVKDIFESRGFLQAYVAADNDGDIARRIVAHARAEDMNLIIIATHGPHDLRTRHVGNLANNVIALSEKPVLLVRRLSTSLLAML